MIHVLDCIDCVREGVVVHTKQASRFPVTQATVEHDARSGVLQYMY